MARAKRSKASVPFRKHVDAQGFLLAFTEAFWECVPEKPLEQMQSWNNLTAFITGRQSKNGGYWEPIEKCVLPQVADKLGLKYQHEYLNFDLVLFPTGDPWGNLIFVEHENQIGGFGEEIEKLMSVLAPLKVGITYGSADQGLQLQKTLQNYFRERHPSINEAPETEYLFLLGTAWDRKLWGWKYLNFKILAGPSGTQFQDAGQELHIEGWH